MDAKPIIDFILVFLFSGGTLEQSDRIRIEAGGSAVRISRLGASPISITDAAVKYAGAFVPAKFFQPS